MKDSYGSTLREKMKYSMSKPALSTSEKFRVLNKVQKQDRIVQKASTFILILTWVSLIAVIAAQVAIYLHHVHII